MTTSYHQAIKEQLEIFTSLKKYRAPQKESARAQIKILLAASVFDGDLGALSLIAPLWSKLDFPPSFADVLALACLNNKKNGPEMFSVLIDCGAVEKPERYLRHAMADKNVDLVGTLAEYLSEDICNDALRSAAAGGNTDVIRALLPHANPKAKNSVALIHAAIFGNKDAVDLLYPLSEPSVALRDLENASQPAHHREGIQHFKNLIKKDKALKQRAKILSKVTDDANPLPKRRLRM